MGSHCGAIYSQNKSVFHTLNVCPQCAPLFLYIGYVLYYDQVFNVFLMYRIHSILWTGVCCNVPQLFYSVMCCDTPHRREAVWVQPVPEALHEERPSRQAFQNAHQNQEPVNTRTHIHTHTKQTCFTVHLYIHTSSDPRQALLLLARLGKLGMSPACDGRAVLWSSQEGRL